MAALTPDHATSIGECISPFDRSIKPAERKKVGDGESERDFIAHLIHDAVENGTPPEMFIEISVEEIEVLKKSSGRFPEKSFLWIIDETSIKIVRERIRNPARTAKPDSVCHTNLTGNGVARSGGEMFFCENGTIYINPYSDRYGWGDTEHWEAVLDYFRTVFKSFEVVDIVDLIKENL